MQKELVDAQIGEQNATSAKVVELRRKLDIANTHAEELQKKLTHLDEEHKELIAEREAEENDRRTEKQTSRKAQGEDRRKIMDLELEVDRLKIGTSRSQLAASPFCPSPLGAFPRSFPPCAEISKASKGSRRKSAIVAGQDKAVEGKNTEEKTADAESEAPLDTENETTADVLKTLRSLKEEVHSLTAENEDLSDELKELTTAHVHSNDKMHALVEELADLKDDKSDLETELAELKSSAPQNVKGPNTTDSTKRLIKELHETRTMKLDLEHSNHALEERLERAESQNEILAIAAKGNMSDEVS